MLTEQETETLDSILVALWQCESLRVFEIFAEKTRNAVEAIVAAREKEWRASPPRQDPLPNPYVRDNR